MVSTFKHDDQGFLVGELLDVNRALLNTQSAGMAVWRGIRSDVKAIAKVLGAQVRNTHAQQRDKAASQPRAIGGQFSRKVNQPAGRAGAAMAPSGSPAGPGRATSGTAEITTRATVSPAGRNARGQFMGASKPSDIETRPVSGLPVSRALQSAGRETVTTAVQSAGRDGRGRFAQGNADSPDKAGRDDSGKLTNAVQKLSASLDGADQLDPTITALKEIKDTVSPLGRGMFSMFGRGAERKKEVWYKRILKAITGKKESAIGGGGGSGGKEDVGFFDLLIGMFGGLLSTAFLPIIASIGAAIVAMAPIVGAALATAIAAVVTAWLLKKAAEVVAPVIKEAQTNFNKGMDDVNKPSIAPAGQVLDASGRDLNDPRRIDQKEAVGTDGRAINDPRRTDLVKSDAPLPPAGSIAESMGRGAGHVKNGLEMVGFKPLDASNDPVARSKMTKKQRAAADLKQRSLETGAQYSAGNIGGLSDQQTRALVASTAMTESSGGNPRIINPTNGFMGRYQAGAGWLSDAGLIKGGNGAIKKAMAKDGFTFGGPGQEDKWGQKGGMTRFLKDDANWNNGLSYQKYLNSPDTQDKAFKTNSDAAYNSLMKNPAVTDKSPENMAGLLKARHIAGMGGALKVADGGKGSVDANGTSARKYYDDVAKDRNGFLGAFSGAPTLSAGAARIPPVVIPSSTPERIAPAPDAAVPAQLNTTKQAPVNVSMREAIGQDVGDRSIAHVVSGGLGMMA